jgi:hypothetical protein
MPKRKTITVDVASLDALSTEKEEEPIGCGEGSEKVSLTGQVFRVTINKDGEAQVGFSIHEDGSIIITSYSSYYTMSVPQNLTLENTRPW